MHTMDYIDLIMLFVAGFSAGFAIGRRIAHDKVAEKIWKGIGKIAEEAEGEK